jgi:hypothetical protein
VPRRQTIRVRAGNGLQIPLHPSIVIDSGLTVLTPETSVEVVINRFVRNRLRNGDFVEVADPQKDKE